MKKVWGETHCPMCEKPLPQDEDYDKYPPGSGEHLCWNYPLHSCIDATIEERLIQLLIRRDTLRDAWRRSMRNNR